MEIRGLGDFGGGAGSPSWKERGQEGFRGMSSGEAEDTEFRGEGGWLAPGRSAWVEGEARSRSAARLRRQQRPDQVGGLGLLPKGN